MARVLFLFIDGIGIGEGAQRQNPFVHFNSRFFPHTKTKFIENLPYGGRAKAIDPSMGIPGLPQSATGQTALLTGINASAIMQRHVSGFPSPTLRKIIDADSIFKKLKAAGKTGQFANALSETYFEKLGERISTTSRAQRAGNFAPKMLEDLRQYRAVSHDLRNRFLRRHGERVPEITPEKCAEILAKIEKETDFTLFEFILTDTIGHAMDMDRAGALLEDLEQFLDTLLHTLDLSETCVLLTSDHGNFEDLSTKTHTHNLVPLHVWHHDAAFFLHYIENIEQVTPAILAFLNGNVSG